MILLTVLTIEFEWGMILDNWQSWDSVAVYEDNCMTDILWTFKLYKNPEDIRLLTANQINVFAKINNCSKKNCQICVNHDIIC